MTHGIAATRDAGCAPSRRLVRRSLAAAAVGAAAAQVALVAAGLPAFPCPAAELGASCPGCGLGRATVALLRGDLAAMLHLHAFAPVVAAGLVLAALLAVLPDGPAGRLSDRVRAVQARFGIGWWIGVALVVYWAVRAVGGQGVPGAHA